MPKFSRLISITTLALATGLVAACSGGGGGSSTGPTPTPTYTAGIFQSSANFDAECAAPRSGFDLEGNRYLDVQGTINDELFWLRSWTDETYLWNDEVPDQNPNNFVNQGTLAYFDELVTPETTASGSPKDNFHFSQPTEEYLRDRNSAPRSGYGARFVLFQASAPRDIRVVYTEPNTPASNTTGGQAKFRRGAKIITIDGVDAINGSDVDTLNDGLYPASAGETHSFGVQYADGTHATFDITSADVTRAPVIETRVIDQSGSKVGYIAFTTFSPFSSEEAIYDAMSQMSSAGVADLVLDLRYNGGGLLAVASQLGYMIAGGSRTGGRTFETLRFNDDAGNINPVTGSRNDPIPFYSTGQGFTLASGTPLPTLNLSRVYILSSGNTCSASESVINSLRGVDVEVVLIGDITCGKPFGFYPTDNCGTTYYSIQFQGINQKGFGDYSDGFVPDDNAFAFGVRLPGCTVEDDLTAPLGDLKEDQLAAALHYRENGACPANPVVSEQVSQGLSARSNEQNFLGGKALATTDLSEAEFILENSRDLTMPY